MSAWRPDHGSLGSWKADETPPLAHFLRSIDHAQMESLPSVNQDVVGVQEALRSLHRAEQVKQAERLEEERQKAAAPKAESYPPFLTIQAPSPDYVEEVRERRLRLMAQEQARRQARKMRGSGYAASTPSAAPPPTSVPTAAPSGSTPDMESEDRSFPPAGDFAERAAEAAFAARVARVAREHPGAIGQRQSKQPASPPRERLGRNDEFSGIWTDDAGNDYELVQSGSVVTERSQQSCGMAMRNELTMFGRIGTLVDDLIRWSDGSIWARQLGSNSGGSSSTADLGSLGGYAWKAAARRKAPGRLAPELADLFSPGPDVASAEWEETAASVAGRRDGRVEGSEQRLWFAPWVQDGQRGI